MSTSVHQILMKAFIVVVIFTLAIVNARPNHFQDNSQLASDQDGASSSGLYDSGDLKPWQMEMMLQRLAEMNLQPGWRDGGRIAEVKRQKGFRQCYFNPISCFKK